MNKQRGFTVIELAVAIVVLAAAGFIFYTQKQNIQVTERDKDRKTAINAMYYSLEEVAYPALKGYPRELSSKTVPSVEPSLFRDPSGRTINEQESDYRYEPTGCTGDVCKGYSLRADLEKEADYVKSSKNS